MIAKRMATVLEGIAPLPFLGAYSIVRYVAGVVLALSGFLLIGSGTRRFVAAGTNVPPDLRTTALVVDGIYGWTRNPLYLGATLVYLGLTVAAGSLWALVLSLPLPEM